VKLLMRKFFQLHDVGIKELLIFGLILLAGYTIWIHKTFVSGAYEKVTEVIDRVPGVHVLDRCGADCQEKIDRKVAEALATVSAKQNTTTVGGGVFATTYIPIGSTFSTRNLDWTDIPGAQSYIDKSKYPSIQSSAFEVSVTNPNASQEVYVRLYNVTEGTVVSQMTLAGDSKLVYGYFSLSAGNKLYQVQMKTQLNATATLNLSRVRISVN